MRLHRAEWSTNCERIVLALAHKGVEVESVIVDYLDRSGGRAGREDNSG
jgi:glutathione S-transferase